MKISYGYCILFVLLFAQPLMAQEFAPLKLWYTQPAKDWREALPVGNGRLGAMVYSHPEKEIIQINEESVWAGVKFNDANPNSLKVLDSVRQLLFADKNEEASELAAPNMLAVDAENSTRIARSFRSYQTLMNLNILPGGSGYTNYRRELDLNTGIVTSQYEVNGVQYRQEVFATAPGNILAVRITSSKPGALQATLFLNRPDPREATMLYTDCSTRIWEGNKLLLSGQINDKNDKEDKGPEGKHMKFAGAVLVKPEGGRLVAKGDSLQVQNANALVLYIDGATNYDFAHLSIAEHIDPVNKLKTSMQQHAGKNYTQLKAAHVADHSKYMKRVNFQLAGDEVAKADLPTDVRLNAVKKGAYDPYLTTLLFQYGRYLLLGSSRKPGLLPANLQGIWSNHIEAPWQADFHTNINLQMNYWQAEVANLPETTAPLFAFMDNIREQGRITARKMYGARGWVMHHATDAFGKTGLQNAMYYGTFPMATAWMCLHFWEHYEFTRNKQFLEKEAYPIMKEHALFIKDFLVKSPEGYLVTSPAYSPENSFKHLVTGKGESLTYGPTMDNQIIREFLKQYITAAHLLNKDPQFADSMQAIMNQLPPTRLGKDGRIMEWIKAYEEPEPGHRHMSHLFGLHPGTQINETTPALLAGARKTLEYRLSHGGGHTGWSRAWIINFYARLRDGEKVYENVQALFAKSIYSNLFDDHPPFQIDGNFGSGAGIAEALLQSQEQDIDLLPALPAAWSEGHITGLKARGGFTVDMKWKAHQLVEARITSLTGQAIKVKYQDKVVTIQPAKGTTVTLNASLNNK